MVWLLGPLTDIQCKPSQILTCFLQNIKSSHIIQQKDSLKLQECSHINSKQKFLKLEQKQHILLTWLIISLKPNPGFTNI